MGSSGRFERFATPLRRHGNEHQIDGEKGSARHMLLPVGWGLADNL
jgi:hypothetical protein